MSAVVNCASYSGGRRIGNLEIDKIHDALRDPKQFVWIGLHEPDEELLQRVQREFSLHDLAIEDAHRAHQRPKIEVYGNTLFIVIRTTQFHESGQSYEWGETHFFVGANFIVSVRHGASTSYVDVRTRCENAPQLLTKGPGFVLYALMDSIVDRYFPLVEMMEQKLDELEDRIFGETTKRATTAELYEFKRMLIDVRRAISPLVDVCNRLMRYDNELIPEDTRPYFRDVCDHLIRLNEMVDSLRELLNTAVEANLSQISISQNEVTKRLAGWAAIIAVPTMIAGIYGMNFRFMPELEWRYSYPVILSFTVGFCAYLYHRFKRSGWF